MTSTDLLRESDPLRYEDPWAADDRQRMRAVVIGAPRATRRSPVTSRGRLWLLVLLASAVFGVFSLREDSTALAAIRFEARLAEEQATVPGLQEAVVADSGRRVYLHPVPVLTNGDIEAASVVPAQDDAFGVSVTLTQAGAAKMRRASAGHIGRPLAVVLDGVVVTAPTVRTAISDVATIDARYTRAEAERIASGLVGR